ncbi:hypothetical protein PAXRUDRAFT_835050 [Paxillus rubicundulus Ve08.2h10]|uniref:Secreted protein n=1 Tax=Paxillus rubicundulus Ve08.2h10 TaxID=930991 RepID=A0A0D0DGZ3_9AGAM|nr:hypothetical protein PAXRUDRAFT_835050 [Paxillus rubicundulus Ve08.2h10]
MQFFLMLLASITSLSIHTLVGVHANCAVCPPEIAGEWNSKTCVSKSGHTFCYYLSDEVYCAYTSSGQRTQGVAYKCPRAVEQTQIGCNPC